MKIITSSLMSGGKLYQLEYHDCDNFDALPRGLCGQIYGACFLGDQLLIVHNGKKDTWGLAGGTIEPGETIEQALIREIREESNMQVLAWRPIGYQVVTAEDGSIIYQLRAGCDIEIIDEFEHDPAGSVDVIKLIDPRDYKAYFDWKEIGDRIISRALELHYSKD